MVVAGPVMRCLRHWTSPTTLAAQGPHMAIPAISAISSLGGTSVILQRAPLKVRLSLHSTVELDCPLPSDGDMISLIKSSER